MLCVYLREIINTDCPILHSNVGRLSVIARLFSVVYCYWQCCADSLLCLKVSTSSHGQCTACTCQTPSTMYVGTARITSSLQMKGTIKNTKDRSILRKRFAAKALTVCCFIWKMWVYVLINVRRGKTWTLRFSRTLWTLQVTNFAFWYYPLSFTHSCHFQRPWVYFKVTAMSNSFNRNFVFLSDYPETVYDCLLHQAGHKNIFIFYFSTYSREINYIFYHLKKRKEL